MTERQERLDAILKSLSQVDDLEASRLSDETSLCVVHEFLPTGCYVLDAIMGGGLPLGRMVEIFGETSTGKSLIAAQCCASVQEAGGIAVYIDTESAVSLPIMEAVGVDTEMLIYSTPDTVEKVFEAMEKVIETEADTEEKILIVWDSIAATSSIKEMDKATGETGYLQHARIISQGLRKMSRSISRRRFGSNIATFGGKAPSFHASIRVELKKPKELKEDKRTVGIRTRARVVKNKVAPPFREAVLPIYFGYGIDDAVAMFEFLKAEKTLHHAGGGWYEWTPEGQDTVRFRISEWLDLYDGNYEALCRSVDAVMGHSDLLGKGKPQEEYDEGEE
jgi:recombination protein RecA